MNYYRFANPDELLAEYGKSLDIYHFIKYHIHYGWYPQIQLDLKQEQILTKLMGTDSLITIQGKALEVKWPITAYLLHQLLYTPGFKVAIIANKQRDSNRRYQGLLYPYDNLPSCFQRPFHLRTVREMHLENGCYVKTFTQETEKHIKGFNPDMLFVEDSNLKTYANTLVKPHTRLVIVEKS